MPGEIQIDWLWARADNLIVLAAEESHWVITDVLILVLNEIASLAGGKHHLIAHSANADEIDVLARHLHIFYHFDVQ